MDYTVEFNEVTHRWEMMVNYLLEGGHKIAAEIVTLKARTQVDALMEAEEYEAMMEMPTEAMPTDEEINQMAEFYGYGKESYYGA